MSSAARWASVAEVRVDRADAVDWICWSRAAICAVWVCGVFESVEAVRWIVRVWSFVAERWTGSCWAILSVQGWLSLK